jgi:hypothetical protein
MGYEKAGGDVRGCQDRDRKFDRGDDQVGVEEVRGYQLQVYGERASLEYDFTRIWYTVEIPRG